MNPASELADLFLDPAGIYTDCEMYQSYRRSEQPPESVPAPSALPPSSQSDHPSPWAAGMGDSRQRQRRAICAASRTAPELALRML